MKVIERNAEVYKAVRVIDGKLLSWMAPRKDREPLGLPAAWVVEYQAGKWVDANQQGTALFAWRHEPRADWIGDGEELWRATADVVDGVLGKNGWCPLTWLYNRAPSLAAFWRDPVKYLASRETVGSGDTIEGLWCSRIKLLERV